MAESADRRVLSRCGGQRVSRIACAAASRSPARRACAAAATTAGFSIGIGTRRRSRSTATRRPIRSTPTSSTAAKSRGGTAVPARSRRSGRASGERNGSDYRVLRTAPLVFSTVDPHALFFASNVVWKTLNGGKSWTQISPDLTRKDSIVPPSVGVYAQLAAGGRAPRRRGVHAGAVVRRPQSHLGGDGRRPDSHDLRRRRALDRRHARRASRQTVEQGLDHRRGALRRADGVRGDQYVPHRRSESAHLPHSRRRQVVDGDRERHRAGRRDQHRARGLQAQRAALCRQRDAGVGLLRRRRPLVVAPPQHAGDVDSRSHPQGRRHRHRHARPVVLDPGRHLRAAPALGVARRARRRRCSSRRSRTASAGASTPTRRSRPTSHGRTTRPTARSSTITSARARRATRRSRSSTRAGG